MNKTIDLLKRYGAIVPPVERMWRMSEHLLVFSVFGKGLNGSKNWMSQRYQTPKLTEFKHGAFMETRRIFLFTFHLFLTLDDDLFVTCAAKNQVKMISSRKADKEGYSVYVVADAFSRIVFGMQSRSRGEIQLNSVKTLLTSLFEVKGKETLNSCILTADSGYEKESFLDIMVTFGLGSVFIIPSYIIFRSFRSQSS